MSCGCTGNAKEDLSSVIREKYGKIARQGGSCCGPSSCGCGAGQFADSIAREAGYSREELAGIPEGANMGLSCGNPTAIASLRPGDVVLDLGSGGGFDVFIAAAKIGPTGRAIGVDMTPEMISTARRNAESYKETGDAAPVEFRLGEIEHLPVADSSVDVVISNCVINLSPDKPQVWKEVARALRPGGRAAVSDLALLRPLPEAVRSSVQALVGCVAGAALVDDIRKMMAAAGLVDIVLEPKPGYIERMTESASPFFGEIMEKLPAGTKLGDFVTNLNITARKPS